MKPALKSAVLKSALRAGSWPGLLPGLWLILLLALVASLMDSAWMASVDFAHHYALVARLGGHWRLPPGLDMSLGEMNVYPHGAHWLASLLGRPAGSNLAGMQMLIMAAFLLLWAAMFGLLLQLPLILRGRSAACLLLLLGLNRALLHMELHGSEIIGNYFFSQLVAQAAAMLVILLALWLEQRRQPRWHRNLLLLLSIWLLCSVHLLPALELLALLALLLWLDGWQRAAGRGALRVWLTGAAWLLAALALVLTNPGYKTMTSISRNDGGLAQSMAGTGGFSLNFGDNVTALMWITLLLLVSSLAMVRRWWRMPAAQRHAWLAYKYLALYGTALAAMCVLQYLACELGHGSSYAVKKYLFAINSVLLLQLAVWGAGLLAPGAGADPAKRAPSRSRAMLKQLLPLPVFALMVFCLLPPQPKFSYSEWLGYEREVLDLQKRVPQQGGKFVYVAQLKHPFEWLPYLFSIGVFKTPRDKNIEDLMYRRPLAFRSQVAATITSLNSALDRWPQCRRKVTAHQLVLIEQACVDRETGTMPGFFDLSRDEPANPCIFSGFGTPEALGRWSAQRQAGIDCKIPMIEGKPATRLALTIQAFLPPGVRQRLQMTQAGGLSKEVQFDQDYQHDVLVVPLHADADGHCRLTLQLPDARSPQALGIGMDRRELGIRIAALEFQN